MARAQIILAATLVFFGCQGSSPEGDLKKLGRAVREGDSAEAVRYLDVDRTTSSLVGQVVTLVLSDSGRMRASRRAPQPSNEMTEGMIRMMQPVIEGIIKQGVYDVISGRPIRVPAAMGKSGADTVSRDSVLQMDPRILSSRSFGDSAFVAVELRPRRSAAPETLSVKMEQSDKVWRVVRLDGLESLIDSLPK